MDDLGLPLCSTPAWLRRWSVAGVSLGERDILTFQCAVPIARRFAVLMTPRRGGRLCPRTTVLLAVLLVRHGRFVPAHRIHMRCWATRRHRRLELDPGYVRDLRHRLGAEWVCGPRGPRLDIAAVVNIERFEDLLQPAAPEALDLSHGAALEEWCEQHGRGPSPHAWRSNVHPLSSPASPTISKRGLRPPGRRTRRARRRRPLRDGCACCFQGVVAPADKQMHCTRTRRHVVTCSMR